MMDKKRLCGYYDYTVILTYIGMFIGFVGITLVLQEAYSQAIFCLMIAGICDMFDGTVAATKKGRSEEEKHFGIQIDSLSDLICFGVLPAFMVYSISEKTVLSLMISGCYVLCALIRLAYFNVLEEKRQQEEVGYRTSYMGLPVTSVALIFPAVYLCQHVFMINSHFTYIIMMGMIAVAFIVPITVKKPTYIGKVVIGLMGTIEFVVLVMGGPGL